MWAHRRSEADVPCKVSCVTQTNRIVQSAGQLAFASGQKELLIVTQSRRKDCPATQNGNMSVPSFTHGVCSLSGCKAFGGKVSTALQLPTPRM